MRKSFLLRMITIIVFVSTMLLVTACSDRKETFNGEISEFEGGRAAGIPTPTPIAEDGMTNGSDTVRVTPAAEVTDSPQVVTPTATAAADAGETADGAGEQEAPLGLEGKTTDELIDMIKNGSELELQSAEEELIRQGTAGLETLITDYLNLCKIDELQMMEEEEEAAKLLEEFGSPKNGLWTIQSSIENVLSRIGTPAVEPLLQLVSDGEIETFMIEGIFVNMGAPAVDTFLSYLDSEDIGIVDSIILVLGQIGDERAAGPLIKVLKEDEAGYYDGSIINALEQIGTPAVEPLIKLLQDNKKYANESAQEEAAEILGTIGDKSAIKPLIEALDAKDVYMRRAAARGLGEINDPEVDACLAEAVSNNKLEIIAGACRYFIRKGDPAMEELLIKALNKHGSTWIAEEFLECGNDKLGEAARKWAEDNGFMITGIPGFGGGIQWGGGNE